MKQLKEVNLYVIREHLVCDTSFVSVDDEGYYYRRFVCWEDQLAYKMDPRLSIPTCQIKHRCRLLHKARGD